MSIAVTTVRTLISVSLCVSVQNPAGGSQQGGAGAGDGVDEGASLHTGLPCGALPQRPALQEHHPQQQRGSVPLT